MNPGFNLGKTGDIVVQEDIYRIWGHVSGVEENQGELQEVRGGDGGVVTPPPHGENKRYSTAIELGSRHQRWGVRDIRGVFSAGTEVGGVTGIWMIRKGK